MERGSQAPTVTDASATGIVSSAPLIYGCVNSVMEAANCRCWKLSSSPPLSIGVRIFRSKVLIFPTVSCAFPDIPLDFLLQPSIADCALAG
jgi:hypothetical protein